MATKKEVTAPAVSEPVKVVEPAPSAVTEERIAALEAKVDDLITRLARKMSF